MYLPFRPLLQYDVLLMDWILIMLNLSAEICFTLNGSSNKRMSMLLIFTFR